MKDITIVIHNDCDFWETINFYRIMNNLIFIILRITAAFRGTPIPGVTDAVICVLCKKRVKTGRMWAIHSKTPQHQHLVQRLQLVIIYPYRFNALFYKALVSQESKPAATETEDNEQHADKGVEGKNEEKSGVIKWEK